LGLGLHQGLPEFDLEAEEDGEEILGGLQREMTVNDQRITALQNEINLVS